MTEPDPNLTVHGEGPEDRALSLGARFRQPQTLLSFAFAIVIVVFLVLRLDIDPAAVWAEIREANPLLYLGGLAVYYLGFVLRTVRFRRMLVQSGMTPEYGVRLPGNRGLLEIMLLGWFANCVVPAKLGDVYRAFLLRRRSGAPFTTTMGTIGAERLIDLVVLITLFLISGLIVFGRRVPDRAEQIMLVGGITVGVGLIGVAVVWVFRDMLLARTPARLTDHLARVQAGLFTNLRNPWQSLGIAIVIWLGEGLRVFLVAWSLGELMPASTAVFIALLSSAATVSPLTPAGLGVVEALLISILPLVGVADDTAAALAILDRTISYWSLIVVGVPLYLLGVRRDVRRVTPPAPA